MDDQRGCAGSRGAPQPLLVEDRAERLRAGHLGEGRPLAVRLLVGISAVGAIAEVVESIDDDGRIFTELSLRAAVAAEDGSEVIRSSVVGPVDNAAALGRELAAELLDRGAAEVMRSR